MAASHENISTWFDRGVKKGATHMLVVCDTFDWDDYPVYVMPGEKARDRAEEFSGKNMQRVMECYLLQPDEKQDQMAEHRALHWD